MGINFTGLNVLQTSPPKYPEAAEHIVLDAWMNASNLVILHSYDSE